MIGFIDSFNNRVEQIVYQMCFNLEHDTPRLVLHLQLLSLIRVITEILMSNNY